MTFTQLRDKLIERGCTRKQATLAIRLSMGLESFRSLCRRNKLGWDEGESIMSQKVDSREYTYIEEVSKVVTEIRQNIL